MTRATTAVGASHFNSSPEIIAHRGYSARYPENTLPALEGALAAGAESLEWDVRVTADGTAVLFHDEDLDRTSDGCGPLASQSWEDLQLRDAGFWFDPRFAGTRIPTLSETLEALGDRPGRIYCELKQVDSPEQLDAILRELKESALYPRTVILSLHHELLKEIRARDETVTLGWVVAHEDDFESCVEQVEQDGRAVLDPDARLLLEHPERTRTLVARGVPLATWTVDDPTEAQTLLELGVRRITTNQVSRLLSWARDVPLSRDVER